MTRFVSSCALFLSLGLFGCTSTDGDSGGGMQQGANNNVPAGNNNREFPNAMGGDMNNTPAVTDGIEIDGIWDSNFGTTEVITEASWDFMELHQYDNVANWAITQNPADDMYSPDTFNKIVWTEVRADSFYYCYVDFGLATLEDALASTGTADASDPANGGCADFPWTQLERQTRF